MTLLIVYVLFLSFTRIEADNEKLLVIRPPYGTYAISWDEVSNAEATSRVFMIRGNNKALGFNTLMGDNQSRILQAFAEKQVSIRGVIIQRVKKISKINPQEFKKAKIAK